MKITEKAWLKIVIALLVIFGLEIFLLLGKSWGDILWTPLELPVEADTIICKFLTEDKTDTLFFDTITSSRVWDTTWECHSDTSYTVVFLIKYPGADWTSSAWKYQSISGIAYSPDGTGTYQLILYALDTSGTDAVVADVKTTVTNAADEQIRVDWTNSSGNDTVNLNSGTYTLTGYRTGYAWSDTSVTVSANVDSLPIKGYDIEVGTPGSADLCNVFGYLVDAGDNAIEGATVVALRVKGPIGTDTTGTTVIIPAIPRVTQSDSLGLFQLHLKRTGTYTDTNTGFYNITATYNDAEIFKVKQIWVPATGNFNLGDTLALR